MDSFEYGSLYKHSEIFDRLPGGNKQSFLPSRGEIVFGALLNRSLNPDAPNVILIGSGPNVTRSGQILALQTATLPVFVKQTTDVWKYEGLFRSAGKLPEEECAALAAEAHRTDVEFAVRLESVLGSDGEFEVLVEGACSQITRNRYERNEDARALCLAHHGRSCCICKIDFVKEYGARGLGFIHVHHLNPIHKADGERKVDPIQDLRPVCPNCHAMLHANGKLITPEDLRAIYWSNDSQDARHLRLQID